EVARFSGSTARPENLATSTPLKQSPRLEPASASPAGAADASTSVAANISTDSKTSSAPSAKTDTVSEPSSETGWRQNPHTTDSPPRKGGDGGRPVVPLSPTVGEGNRVRRAEKREELGQHNQQHISLSSLSRNQPKRDLKTQSKENVSQLRNALQAALGKTERAAPTFSPTDAAASVPATAPAATTQNTIASQPVRQNQALQKTPEIPKVPKTDKVPEVPEEVLKKVLKVD
ncbi:MAG: hypothetical protein KGI61_03095, partial [Patescibacteria group bacterium]|nr:hypothetical protein [Patescibacteria group bacterium]